MKMQGRTRSAAMGSGEGEDEGEAAVYGANGVAAGAGGTPDGSYGNGHSDQALNEGGGGTMMPNDGRQATGVPDEHGMPGLLPGQSGEADRPGGGMLHMRGDSGPERLPGDGMGGGGGGMGGGGGSGGSGRDDKPSPQVRRCATMEVHRRLLSAVPEYAARRAEIENLSQRYELGDATPQRSGITRIPVVVHVVYNTAVQNISQSQIDSQIAVLNRDFRRTNPDVSTTPPPFLALAADARIEFELATVDPGGSPTTGVERRHTSVTSFSYEDDGVKSAATGGMNAWPSDRYLNMWVCPLGGLLGYAQFPGGPAHTDGVVINYSAFGTNGTAAAPYNLGRTATHEIGHWLNLIHIWGDDGNGCTGTDHVSDTPNQGGYNIGVPTFPRISCSNGPNGDMFMNYMDYVDDRAMVMFSTGQVARMQACLDGPRSTIGLGSAAIKPSSNPMVSWGPNRLDVFVQGADSVLYHKWWNGSAWGPSATGFQSLGGVCTSVPQAVSWGPDRLDVFVTSTDSALYHKWWNGSAWGPSPTGFEYQGGVCVGEPRAVSWGANRLDVFVVGANRALYHKAWTGSGWWPGVTGFDNLGGTCVGQPEVVSWGPNRLDIFVIGTDRALYHKAWTGSAWYPSATGYERLGGICMSAPRAVCWGANRIDIFVTGTDGAVYRKWWNGSAWGPSVDGFERLGGVCVGQPEVVSWGPNRLDIFMAGTDSALYHKWWNGSAWGPSLTGYERMGGILTSVPRVVSWAPNRLDVFATGTDSALYHKAWTGSAWTPSLSGFQYLGGVITALREEGQPEQGQQAYAPAPMAMPEMAPDSGPQFIAPAQRDIRPSVTMN